MPFTFSHPALILPFRYLPRSWFSLTGLIIGSIVPDFEYIVNETRDFSHTLQGALWLDIPLALLSAFIFHTILRDTLIVNLPTFMYRRFVRFENFHWTLYFKKNIVIIILSILLGIGTHLLWDSFTHGTGYFVTKFPALQNMVSIAGIQMPFHEWLWFLNSIVGAIVLAIAIYLLPPMHTVRKHNIRWFWMQFFLLTALLSALLLTGSKNKEIDDISMIFLRSGLLSLLFTSVLSKKT